MRYLLTASLVFLTAAPAALAEGAAMPQLDPTWFASQLFWLAVSFTLLYLIVSLFIAPRVGGVLGERERAISEAIRMAELFRKEAAEAKGNFEQATQEAKAKAAQILAETQAEIAKIAAEANEKLTDELDRKLNLSDIDLKKATSRALTGIEAAAVPLAQAMAEKLLGEKISEADVRDAMNGLEKAA